MFFEGLEELMQVLIFSWKEWKYIHVIYENKW